MKNVLPIIFLLIQFNASAFKWKVGATQTYTTPSAIVNLVQNSDTIEIDGGVYLNDPVTWIKKDLVFKGLGTGSNRTKMKWNGGDIPNGKGLWVFSNTAVTGNITIENIVFEGARVSDANGGNGAGVRFQVKNLTINKCLFDSCQNGILEGGSYTGAVVSIQNTEFFANGYEVTGDPTYSGYEHNIYISAQTDSLLVRNCWFHDPRGEANSLKTRAQKSYVLYNLIDEANGQGSWEINIAQGGLNVIMGNMIIQGAGSINHGIISYDAATNPLEDFYFINNTVINKYNGNFKYFNVTPTSGINKFKIYNNVFAKSLSSTMTNFISGTLGSALDTLANRTLTNYTTVGFANTVTGDYHLTSSATSLRDNATNAGQASSGFALSPLFEYSNFASSLVPRIVCNGINDIGAYEYITPLDLKSDRGAIEHVAIFPNPCKSVFYLSADGFSSKDIELVIVDLAGKSVKFKSNDISETKIAVNHELPSGIYIYKVLSNKSILATGKLVVE